MTSRNNIFIKIRILFVYLTAAGVIRATAESTFATGRNFAALSATAGGGTFTAAVRFADALAIRSFSRGARPPFHSTCFNHYIHYEEKKIGVQKK